MSRENRVPEDPVGFIQDRVHRGQILWTYHVSMCLAGRFTSRAVILAAVDTYQLVQGGKRMARVLVDYLPAIGWGVVGAVSLAFGLGILLRVFDWLTPIDEWEEIKKGFIRVFHG